MSVGMWRRNGCQLSYSDDTIAHTWGYPENFYKSPGFTNAAFTHSEPVLELIMVDYTQFPLTETTKVFELAALEERGWENIEVRESYQTSGMNYRQEYWGRKFRPWKDEK